MAKKGIHKRKYETRGRPKGSVKAKVQQVSDAFLNWLNTEIQRFEDAGQKFNKYHAYRTVRARYLSLTGTNATS